MKKENEEIGVQDNKGNSPIERWGLGCLEITKWQNIDEKTGNEWFNYTLKHSYKDKLGDWHDTKIRCKEDDIDTLITLFTAVKRDESKKKIRK